jgi:hypothetical protein
MSKNVCRVFQKKQRILVFQDNINIYIFPDNTHCLQIIGLNRDKDVHYKSLYENFAYLCSNKILFIANNISLWRS